MERNPPYREQPVKKSRAAGRSLLFFSEIIPRNQDIVNGYAEERREREEIVYRRQRLPALPFVNGLRSVEAEKLLQVPHGEAAGFSQAQDVLPRRWEINHGKPNVSYHTASCTRGRNDYRVRS